MSTNIRPETSQKNPYYISKHRHYELKHFCLQYPEWKKSYLSIDGAPSSPGWSNAVPNGGISDPTVQNAERRLYFRTRMELVEQAAEEAAGDLSKYMLKAVTNGLSYEKVAPPCCKEVWYAAYRRFFWLLDKTRK